MALHQEEGMELKRDNLHISKNFKVTSAYDIINRTNQAKVDKVQIDVLTDMLETHNIKAMEKDVQVLLERYDKDKDGIVTFEDFANEIVTVPLSDAVKLDEHWQYR